MANRADFIMRVKPAQFKRLLAEVRACRICEAHLPNPPRPVLRASPTASVLIVGQAPHRHPKLRAHLPAIRLTLLIGSYAQDYYLGARRKKTLAETVRARDEYLPEFFPLPHPSPRNRLWMKKNAWFEREVLPQLRRRFRACLRGAGRP